MCFVCVLFVSSIIARPPFCVKIVVPYQYTP